MGLEYNGIKFDTTGGREPNTTPSVTSFAESAQSFFFITKFWESFPRRKGKKKN